MPEELEPRPKSWTTRAPPGAFGPAVFVASAESCPKLLGCVMLTKLLYLSRKCNNLPHSLTAIFGGEYVDRRLVTRIDGDTNPKRAAEDAFAATTSCWIAFYRAFGA